MLHGGEVILAGVGLQAAVDFGGKLSPECGVLPGGEGDGAALEGAVPAQGILGREAVAQWPAGQRETYGLLDRETSATHGLIGDERRDYVCDFRQHS